MDVIKDETQAKMKKLTTIGDANRVVSSLCYLTSSIHAAAAHSFANDLSPPTDQSFLIAFHTRSQSRRSIRGFSE